MLLLSSIKRLRMYTGLGDSKEETRALAVFLSSISRVIQLSMLERDLELKLRTEYFDSEKGTREYFTKAFPIVSITSAHTDITGLYTGSEVAEINYFIGQYNKSIVFSRSSFGNYEKGLRTIYTGGVATHAVNSVYVLTSLGTSPPDPDSEVFVSNDSLSSCGIVHSYNDTTKEITIESLYGAFSIGDVLTFSAAEGGEAIANTGGTIASIVSQSLVEQMPNIGTAVELEIRYLQKNKERFETIRTDKEGNLIRRMIDAFTVYDLQPETKLFLQGEARVWL